MSLSCLQIDLAVPIGSSMPTVNSISLYPSKKVRQVSCKYHSVFCCLRLIQNFDFKNFDRTSCLWREFFWQFRQDNSPNSFTLDELYFQVYVTAISTNIFPRTNFKKALMVITSPTLSSLRLTPGKSG